MKLDVLFHFLSLPSLKCQGWIEWVPTRANCADVSWRTQDDSDVVVISYHSVFHSLCSIPVFLVPWSYCVWS